MRKRIKFKLASELGEKFLRLDIKFGEIDFKGSLKLSQKENLSFYDASYLYLSRELNAQLVTLDKRLSASKGVTPN